jgi:hypothetical protein
MSIGKEMLDREPLYDFPRPKMELWAMGTYLSSARDGNGGLPHLKLSLSFRSFIAMGGPELTHNPQAKHFRD